MSSDVAAPGGPAATAPRVDASAREKARGAPEAGRGPSAPGGPADLDDPGTQGGTGSAGGEGGTGITCRLEELLAERSMTMTELSRRTGITMANLSIMKNNKAKAIRMTTIAALCQALRITPGQLLVLSTEAR